MIGHYHPSYIVAEDPTSYATPKIEPVHLFSSGKDIAVLRKQLLRQWLFGSVELWLLIFLVSALYLGTGTNPSKYTKNINVAVVDFDGDLAGSYFLNAFRQSAPGNTTLNWRFKYPSDYNNNIDDIPHDVENGQVWAIVALRTNTTRLINATLSAFMNTTRLLISPFVSTPPILVIYEDGRNSFTVNNFILPAIRSAVAVAGAQYGQMLRRQLIANLSSSENSSSNENLQLRNAFQLGSLLANPLTAFYHSLHPASPFIGQLATTLGYVYLYLISGMIVGRAITFVTPFVGKIHVIDLMVYRVFNGFFQACIISLIYSLIVLWFFDISSGSLFMRYWMFNWLATMVFGIIFVIFTINLGRLGNFFLTVFIILMLAGATIQIALELSPYFYRYGYGLPLYRIMNGGRHLLFGSHSYFSLDVGILLIYFFVFWTLAAITGILWMKRQERKIAKEKQKTEAIKEKPKTETIKQKRKTKPAKEKQKIETVKEKQKTKIAKKIYPRTTPARY